MSHEGLSASVQSIKGKFNLSELGHEVTELTGIPVDKIGIGFSEPEASGSAYAAKLHIFLDNNEIEKKFGGKAQGGYEGMTAFGISPALINIDRVTDQIARRFKDRGFVVTFSSSDINPVVNQKENIKRGDVPVNYILDEKRGSIAYISTDQVKQQIQSEDGKPYYGHMTITFHIPKQKPEIREEFERLYALFEGKKDQMPSLLDQTDNPAAKKLLEAGASRINKRSPIDLAQGS